MFSPSLMFLINISAMVKKIFSETWDLSPTGIGEILKSNIFVAIATTFSKNAHVKNY